MNTHLNPHRVPLVFGHESRFELVPHIGSLAAGRVQRAFEQLKNRLLEPVLGPVSDSALRRELCLAANEAAAVAWTTPFPLLVLPVLLEEKTAEARHYSARSEDVRNASESFAATVG